MITKDIKGKKIGKLTVIKDMPMHYKRNGVLWKCKCECGNIAYIPSSKLINKSVNSCGCSSRGKYIGKTVGDLKCISYDNNKRKYKCECICGKEIYVRTSSLTRKTVTSCGCKSRAPREYSTVVGEKIDKLTVISYNQRTQLYKCVCDCGKTTYKSFSYLRYRGRYPRSCNCAKISKSKK